MSMERNLSCYKYPTSVVFVDDKQNFLQNISDITNCNLPYILFDDPSEALEFLTNDYVNPVTKELTTIQEVSKVRNQAKIPSYWETIYNKKRFEEVSVIVVDYSMPVLDGEAFCTKLKAHFENMKFKPSIIMLTGQADEGTAINLFNAGIINKFIPKDLKDIERVLKEVILEQHENYFKNKSSMLYNELVDQKYSCLSDPVFQKLLLNIQKRLDISEYYIIDTSGSLFMLTNDGRPVGLIVNTPEDIRDYIDIARDYHADYSIIKHLEDKTRIPYFPSEKEMFNKSGGMAWEPYMYNANMLQGERSIYYYALVTDRNIMPLLNSEKLTITSLKEYMKEFKIKRFF